MLLEKNPSTKFNFFNYNQEEKKYLELTKQIMDILNANPEKYSQLNEFFKKYQEQGFNFAISPNIINMSNVFKLFLLEAMIALTLGIYGVYAMLTYEIEGRNNMRIHWGLPLGETLLITSGAVCIFALIAINGEKQRFNQIKNELTQLLGENNIENVNVVQFLEYLKTNRKVFLTAEATPLLETEIRLA